MRLTVLCFSRMNGFGLSRAGLTIGQTGQMPGASPFWGPHAWISKHSFTVFHSVRLFTMRQNCRAFWLLHLVYRSGKLITLSFIVFEWLKRIEPNSTTLSMTEELYWKSVQSWTYAKSFLVRRQRPNFAYPFQVADDAMQMDVHKTLRLNPFYRIGLCSINLHSSSYVWNIFYTSAIRHAFLS